VTKIPFTDDSAHIETDFCTARRLKETLAFIRSDDLSGRVLDIGEKNFVGRSIANARNIEMDNTEEYSDFNHAIYMPNKDYKFVLCFEVLEHVMNPLLFIKLIKNLLDEKGVLYLSTPIHNPLGFYFNETAHFAEYRESSIRTLLEYSGFTITDVHKFHSIPFWQNYLHGGGLIRGTLRALTQETILLRAIKA
jgi:hypothetical protein